MLHKSRKRRAFGVSVHGLAQILQFLRLCVSAVAVRKGESGLEGVQPGTKYLPAAARAMCCVRAKLSILQLWAASKTKANQDAQHCKFSIIKI
jgi:hypothetical protein